MNMSRLKLIMRGLISLMLIIYLVFATKVVNHLAAKDVCAGMKIVVNDTSATPFVTSRELARELHGLPTRAKGMKMTDINTDSLRSILARFDKIERVEVVRFTNDSIIIVVDPMRPIARIFDGPGSYYINREGKRISADARYHIDVPVIQGHFGDSVFTPLDIVPLLDYLAGNGKWNSMVSMIKVDSPHDVMLIPSIRGQVINIGAPDVSTFDDKFRRLDKMFADVIPLKGWNYYDTISVKWKNQVVASRRDKKLPDTGYIVAEESDDSDVSTMMAAEGVAPGQAMPGKKAKNEKPIPAAKPQKTSPEKAEKTESQQPAATKTTN